MANEELLPIYEEAEGTIRGRMLARIPSKWRKEPGDFMYDAVAPSPLEVKQLQTELDEAVKNAFPQYAEGIYLDYKAAERGLERKPATAAVGYMQFSGPQGTVIPSGTVVSTLVIEGDTITPVEFHTTALVTIDATAAVLAPIECIVEGAIGNVQAGAIINLESPVDGITAVINLQATTGGADEETDDDLRARLMQAYSQPTGGGTKADYEIWAKEVSGVTTAKALPLNRGPGTVDVVIVGPTGIPSTQLINDTQAHIDGVRPVGADALVVAPTTRTINVTADVTPAPGYTLADVTPAVQAAIAAYIGSIIIGGTWYPSRAATAAIATGKLDDCVITAPDKITLGATELAVAGAVTVT
jgi:uncharacterized phage protein gp47/JayE